MQSYAKYAALGYISYSVLAKQSPVIADILDDSIQATEVETSLSLVGSKVFGIVVTCHCSTTPIR